MKRYVFLPLVATLILWACSNTKTLSADNKAQTGKEILTNHQTPPVVNSFKKERLYGYQFKLPANYSLINKDVKSIDLNGNIKKNETVYKDSISGSKLHIVFHPGEAGQLLYTYYQKDKKAETVKAGNNNALQYIENITRDGKGHLLKNKLIRTKIFFLNQNEPGCMELVFDRLETDKPSGEVFAKILKDIKKL